MRPREVYPARPTEACYWPTRSNRVARGEQRERGDKVVNGGDKERPREMPAPPCPPPAPAAAPILPPRLLSSVAPGKPFASSTPYAQSQKLQLGLDNLGKIRPCPSTNPGCVSTNPLGSSGSFASPLLIPDSSAGDKAVASLRQAIEKTQGNVDFKVDQDTPYGQYTPSKSKLDRAASVRGRPGMHELTRARISGHYIEAEMDGGVGRDVMEFLVKGDAGVVAYRCMATKVTFVYPFTTAVGDSKGQKQRVAAISQELGWYAPDIQSSMDSDDDAGYPP
ncbi:thylakoid lumenal 17.9 kDa protein, chloroplastic [Panicum miliaceum]|uniref:Thylakoid lumenal 17.9 kDa protein, chloroplastic n=1 Tax=Panicum miliaceum TaxID=4540 RepID=A0A3L6SRZ9_PANMI|nr:thylakoid lumenal 17.9 kDa protein, chloroplastic [Panicum miliaceum]